MGSIDLGLIFSIMRAHNSRGSGSKVGVCAIKRTHLSRSHSSEGEIVSTTRLHWYKTQLYLDLYSPQLLDSHFANVIILSPKCLF